MNDTLLVWGTGGHARVVLDIARGISRFDRIVFVDDDRSKAGLFFCECPLIGGPEELHRFAGGAFVIAIGNNHTRAHCFRRALEKGLLPTALVHPTAVIAPSVS